MDHNLEGFPVDESDGEEAEGPVDEQVNLNPAADEKERNRVVQQRYRDKKKVEIEQMKERLKAVELEAYQLNARNGENQRELSHWRQLSTSLVPAVSQIESQSKLSLQLVQQSRQMTLLLLKIMLHLQQPQQHQSHDPVLDNLGIPSQENNPKPLQDLRHHQVLDNLGTPNQENNPKPLQDLRHHQALQTPSMNDLDNTDTGNLNFDDCDLDFEFNLEDELQICLLDSAQDHREECVNAKLDGHGNKSLGKKRATSSDDLVLPVDQYQFAKLPKLSHPSGFGNFYVGESSKSFASDFSDPFSIANCMRELNKVKGLDTAQYRKAMINFGDREYRIKFILMREDFRKDWLSSNETI